MGKPRYEKSKATNRHISSSTKCNYKQAVEKSNERPEWLPDGWNVDFKTRKSGSNMGHGYKDAIEKSTIEDLPPGQITEVKIGKGSNGNAIDSALYLLKILFMKLITGAIPVEENIAIQGSFQEPVNRHDQKGGGWTVLEFGFSSISHSGSSFDNAIGQKSKPGQQSSSSSSLLPQEKPSLHGFSGVAP